MPHFKDQKHSNPSIQQIADNWKTYHSLFEQVKKDWRQPIRDFYIKEMGVRLVGGETSNRQTIDINIKPILRESLILDIQHMFGDMDFEEYQKLKAFLVAAENAHEFFKDTPENYEDLSELIELTRRKLSRFDLEDTNKKFIEILLFEEPDVFGRYVRVSSNKSEIDLFVVPCVLFCQLNNLDLKAFVIMVLAHELAHGYNHLGNDKDNYLWDSFWEVDTFLKEGLAQYYTKEFLRKYKSKLPQGTDIFKYLLEYQSDEYKSFQKWKATSEQIYFAFIETRRNNRLRNRDYLSSLEDAKQRIKGDKKTLAFEYESDMY